VTLALEGLPAVRDARVVEYRIDRTHSNAYTAWQRMGSPPKPTPAEFAELIRAGGLEAMGLERSAAVSGGATRLALLLPRQSVSLVVLSW